MATPANGTGWSGSRPLPGGDTEEGRAFLQDRLSLFARIVIALSFGFFLLAHVITLFQPGLSWSEWLGGPGDLAHLVTIGLLFGLWLLCRRGRLGRGLLAAIDHATMVLLGVGYALMGSVMPQDAHQSPFIVLLAFTNTLLARSILVPSTTARTLWVGLASSLPVAVGLFHLEAISPLVHSYESRAVHTGYLVLWLGVAVTLATVASQVIYGLRQEVREARQLGQYTLIERLGEGGMGEVYLARHALLRRPTAIKLLPPERAGQTNLARFEREVQLTSRLAHPNTIAIFDYGHTPDGVFYYAMEYLEGITLEELIRSDGPQPPARVIHVLRQVCGALQEAHGIGLIHRDIKPANVMLCERGGEADVVKVFDFGLVKEIDGGQEVALSTANTVAGTPLYLSPEAILEPDKVDGRSDLYSLGAVGYFLVTGTHVFPGASVYEVIGRHLKTEPEPPSKRLGRDLPSDLESLILRALDKDPERRFADARTMREALGACADAGGWTEARARAWWACRAAGAECTEGGRQRGRPPSRPTLAVDLERHRRQ